MTNIDFRIIKKVLRALSGQIDDFYLAGGTALSVAYFHHRESYDVDLFTKQFSIDRIFKIIKTLENSCRAETEVIVEQVKNDMAKMVVYKLLFNDGAVCRVDFAEDLFELINPLRRFDELNVLSLEDIYLRKVYAVSGYVRSQNIIGQDIMIGGRQEAKDFYDLYCLSHTSIPLSEFAAMYGDAAMREGLVRWYRTYDRMQMKTGLLDLIISKEIDARLIEKHFEREIDKLLSAEIGI